MDARAGRAAVLRAFSPARVGGSQCARPGNFVDVHLVDLVHNDWELWPSVRVLIPALLYQRLEFRRFTLP